MVVRKNCLHCVEPVSLCTLLASLWLWLGYFIALEIAHGSQLHVKKGGKGWRMSIGGICYIAAGCIFMDEGYFGRLEY